MAGLVAPTTNTLTKLKGDNLKAFTIFKDGALGIVGGILEVNASGSIQRHKKTPIIL